MDNPLTLDNLNILIGPNGAGKSNLLEMVAFLPDALKDELPTAFKMRRSVASVASVNRQFPMDLDLTWELAGSPKWTMGIDLIYRLVIEAEEQGIFVIKREILEERKPRYQTEHNPYKHLDFKKGRGAATPWTEGQADGLRPVDVNGLPEDLKSAQKLALEALSSPRVYPVLDHVRSQVLSWTFYNANDMDVRAIKREPTEIDALQKTLTPDGRNLGMALYNLIQAGAGDFEDNLQRTLRSMYTGHRGLKFPLVDSTHFELRWQLDPHPRPLKFDQRSDGTIRMLCWVVALSNPQPPALICIDEPELGIHPAWLPILAALIRDAADRTQVIISTHSPELLDEFTEQAETVIVCSQDEQGHAAFERLDRDALQEWLDRYRLGQMFRSGHPELGGWPR
jgi:predicted ATPase